MEYQKEERYCSNCNDYTPQITKDSEHERDASGDHQICLRCHWHYSGFTGKFSRPDKYDLEYEESLKKELNI